MSLAIPGINCESGTHRKPGLLAVHGQAVANSAFDYISSFGATLQQNNRKFIIIVARDSVYDSAGKAKNMSQATERSVAFQISIAGFNLLYSIQVKNNRCKVSPTSF